MFKSIIKTAASATTCSATGRKTISKNAVSSKVHRFMGKAFHSLMIAMAIVSFASCDSKHPSKLVGKWKIDYGMSSNSLRGIPEDMELLKDGTGLCERMSITWEVSDKRLIMKATLGAWAGNYEISGSELRLINDDGRYAILRKQ